MPFNSRKWARWLLVAVLLAAPVIGGQARTTTPAEHLGHAIGDDYFLANYSQLTAYWDTLDRQSDRLRVEEIGRSTEGRSMVLAIITSPENHRRLARYREIASLLARAEDPSEETARQLAAEGKAVVWIDGGLHADETLGAQQLIETAYDLVSRRDAETLRILDDTIILLCPVNPDGMDLVSDWYMRESRPERRSLRGLPRLYQKYAGHDNNRDFFMSALAETRVINRVLYREWFPQIVYDHHQSAPAGTVMFAPPFRDPFNYALDPLVMTTLGEVGAAMQTRLGLEGKAGVTTRSGADYSAWWNGGLRTTPYFHNMIGILTETIGGPTPVELPFTPAAQIPRNDLPFPASPQTWRFRQSIEYSITANRAVLDYAARNKDRLLYGIYRMGRNAIERGSRDHWTITARALSAALNAEPSGRNGSRAQEALRTPDRRDARGYVVPSDQPDFLTATKFINALIDNGVAVEQANAAFKAAGRSYPAGSYVIKTAQAFRPHILDMFEPQDHPDDFPEPGGPPYPPYDGAGWTLAFQMGVQFDRILDGFDGPFARLTGAARPPAGSLPAATKPAGYVFSHGPNDAFIAINRLVENGETVYWVKPDGVNYVTAESGTRARLQKLADDVGLRFEAVSTAPDGERLRLRPVRVGLWDKTGGSAASGWARLILENFAFRYTIVDAAALNGGNLQRRFDVIILAGDGLPPQNVSALARFVEDGGTILAIGSSSAFGFEPELPSRLPIADAWTESLPGIGRQRLPSSKFFVPGSILSARVDQSNPLAFGLPERIDLYFDKSPAFRLLETNSSVKSVAWFDTDRPLRSGWAWGQEYLKDAVAVVDARIGKGRVVLYGPEILFRAQSHGTFKLLFNAIYLARAESK
jgi:hypothetical protein